MRARTLFLVVTGTVAPRVALAEDPGATCHPGHTAAPQVALEPAGPHDDTHAHHHDHASHGTEAPAGHLHDHGIPGGVHHHGAGETSVAASLGLVAGTYDQRLYEGAYQGAVAGARVAYGRFGAAVSVPLYHLTKNGVAVTGVGDTMVHAHATLLTRDVFMVGAMAMVMLPSGDGHEGLGMGHVMWMPQLWGMWSHPRVVASMSAGLGYAMGGAGAHAQHGGGAWPPVDPMNGFELAGDATVMVPFAGALAVGVRAAGAVPVDEGASRLVGGVRVGWRAGRVETAAEVLGAIVGDPFGMRGLVETTVRFR